MKEETIDEKINQSAEGEIITTKTRGWFDFLLQSKVDFEGQKENEKIIVFTRRHWLVLFSPIFSGLLASLLPFIVIIISAQLLIKYNLSTLFTLLWAAYLMMIWYYIFYKLTMHSLDTWIVTTERIIDISQIGLFRRKVSELHLTSIEDISVNTNGFIQSHFDFGNLEIQTAARTQRFLFEEIPDPIKVKDKIMNAAMKHNGN